MTLHAIKSPSGWHDDAYQRDAGHDAMQMDVFERIKASHTTDRWLWHSFYEDPPADLAPTDVQVELPIIQRRTEQIIAFVDVAEFYNTKDLILYEIKPKIHSVGGCVRQATALYHAARQNLRHNRLSVVLVPRYDDQKLDQLIAAYPFVAAWPGTNRQLRFERWHSNWRDTDWGDFGERDRRFAEYFAAKEARQR